MAKPKNIEPEPDHEITLNLSTDEIAARESDKAALLAQVKARVPQSVAAPAVDEAPATAADVVETGVEPVDLPNPGRPRSMELRARLEQIQAEQAEHVKAMERTTLTFEADVRALVAEQANAAAEESRVVDPRVTERLKDALTKLSVPVNDDDPAVATETAWQERLRARAAAALSAAESTEKSLRVFEKTYGPMLEKLASVGRDTWLRGLPTPTSLQKIAAVRQANHIMQMVDIVRDTLAGGFTNITKQSAAIRGLVTQAKLRGPWPIPPTTRDGREVDFIQAVHELSMTNGDTLTLLNEAMAGLTATVESNVAAKRKAAADEVSTAPIQFEPSFQQYLDAKAAVHDLENPERANVNWSPFASSQSE